MCNAFICANTHDMIGVVVAAIIAAIVSGILIWVMETGQGRGH